MALGADELPPESVAEFERQYAARSRVTVEQLRAWGLVATTCQCGDEQCSGFAMQFPSARVLRDELKARGFVDSAYT